MIHLYLLFTLSERESTRKPMNEYSNMNLSLLLKYLNNRLNQSGHPVRILFLLDHPQPAEPLTDSSMPNTKFRKMLCPALQEFYHKTDNIGHSTVSSFQNSDIF